jgi:predicted flap endonuclease-1-like 5' DNA nuclease
MNSRFPRDWWWAVGALVVGGILYWMDAQRRAEEFESLERPATPKADATPHADAAPADTTHADAAPMTAERMAADKPATLAATGELDATRATATSELAPATASTATASAATASAESADDDLQKLEGIGPKVAGLLRAAGITTFARLAAASEDTLRTILSEGGMRLAPTLPSWPTQAALAAKGDWAALEQYQATLSTRKKS